MAIESFIVECLGEEYYSIYKSMKTGQPVKLPLENFASVDMIGEFNNG